jgi:hypothetical protein
LFHGGKLPLDSARDPQLLREGLAVLEFALGKCPELKEVFFADIS